MVPISPSIVDHWPDLCSLIIVRRDWGWLREDLIAGMPPHPGLASLCGIIYPHCGLVLLLQIYPLFADLPSLCGIIYPHCGLDPQSAAEILPLKTIIKSVFYSFCWFYNNALFHDAPRLPPFGIGARNNIVGGLRIPHPLVKVGAVFLSSKI